MTNILTKFNHKRLFLMLALITIVLAIAPEVLADPFTKIDAKVGDFKVGLMKIIGGITVVVVIIIGLLSYKGILPVKNIGSFLFGTIVIASATEIAVFLVG